MKNTAFLLVAVSAFLTTLSASALTMKINKLSCSGMGMATGYTTIQLVGYNKLNITSVKYFITSTDNDVRIVDSKILDNGQVQLSLLSTRYKSSFELVMSGPVGPASFITAGGTDTLNCQSNIQANQ